MMSRIGSFVSALAAALSASCCVVPVALLTLGFTHLGIFGVLMRYRPLTLSLSFLMLGAAFYAVYRPQAQADCAKGVCSPQALRRRRWLVWVSTGLMLGFVALSYAPITMTMTP